MQQHPTETSAPPTADRLLTTADAADWLGLAPYTLRRWRSEGRGPHWVKVGRLARYRHRDLEVFAAERVVSPGGEQS